MDKKIKESIEKACSTLDFEVEDISVLHPIELSHGDYYTNVAMVLAGKGKGNPKELAEKIISEIEKEKPEEIDKIEIAGNGFINFYLERDFFTKSIEGALKEGNDFAKGDSLSGKKIMVEYTDPNPFKEFHIGHLMSNSIGESISRLLEYSGAEVKRANYQGDVGLHVAKAIWGLKKLGLSASDVGDINKAYVSGSNAYEENTEYKEEIDKINTEVYSKENKEINTLYKEGRGVSLKHFEEVYKKLGTKFDFYFFESETQEKGLKMVKDNTPDVFEESDGAVVFKGEEHGLHTRVFISSKGLPTYEAKDLGLAEMKREKYSADQYIVVTASEQTEYFKVVLKALEQIDEDLAKKIKHIAHGMMRLSNGKMSSRKGNVITGESLLGDVFEVVLSKIKDELSDEEKEKIAEVVSMSAIKYSILKHKSGGDIAFDFDKSISFEGDSGPYLQYTFVRTKSLLQKGKDENILPSVDLAPEEISDVEKLIYRFPEIVLRSAENYEPHYMTTYLIELTGAFNSYYAIEKIIDKDNKYSPYKLAVAFSVGKVIEEGLYLLGIKVPERM